ncbi:unnamed protein product [Phytomonas sp. Hart1]|nr:unnamed protein product [Phytomonas sp. Hart1]|eukprot:CCW66714.1 unnamed protein product [Phytomonas sp. isolate Hart1]
MPFSSKASKSKSYKKHSFSDMTNEEPIQSESCALLKHKKEDLTRQESRHTTVGMPEKSSLGTHDAHTTIVAVANDTNPFSNIPSVTLSGSSVESLLQNGRFLKHPQHYLDLFTPLLEFFVYYMHPSSALVCVHGIKCTSDDMDETVRMETEGVIVPDVGITPTPHTVVNTNNTLVQSCTGRGANICNQWDNDQSKNVAIQRCCAELIGSYEKEYTVEEGSSEHSTSGPHSHFFRSSTTARQQQQSGSFVVDAWRNGAYCDSMHQSPREFKEQLEAQMQLLKVIAFPMTVLSYFASYSLEDIFAQDSIERCFCNFSDHSGSYKKWSRKEVYDPSINVKSTKNGDHSPKASKMKQSWPQTGEDFDQMLKYLAESCRSHYNLDKLNQLMHLLNEAASRYLPAFPDDNAYLMAKGATFVMEHWSRSASHGKFTTGIFTLAHRSRLKLLEQAVPCIQAITGILRHHTRCRLALMSPRPRVQRVGSRLHLSPKEVDTLTFLLLCHCGAMLCASINVPQTPLALAHQMNLTPKELMWFLNEHRPHMKQGLITSDARQRNGFIDCHVAMQQEVVTALTGDDLTEEQLIKLERTALAEVLNEERRQQERATEMTVVSATVIERAMDSSAKRQKRPCDNQIHSGSGLFPHRRVPRLEDGEDGLCVSSPNTRSVSPSNVSADENSDDVVDFSLRNLTPGLDSMALAPRGYEVNDSTRFGSGENHVSDCVRTSGGGLQNGVQESDTTSVGAGITTLPMCTPGGDEEEFPTGTNFSTYKTDFEYMEAAFNLIATFIRIRTAEGDIKDDEDCYQPKTKLEATLRELKGRQRVWMSVHRRRVQATLEYTTKGHGYLPRIEQLSQRLGLNELEKQVLLLMVGNVVSHDILIAINGRYGMRDGQRVLTVGYILFVLCENLQERIAVRKSFYKSSPLISNNILSLSLDSSCKSRFNTDLMDYVCDIDRKIVDYLMGTETETTEMVPGSRLYSPTVTISNVVLPSQTTDLVLSTIENYSLFERCKVECGFGKGLGSGASGLVILFYGPSGTGKTMLANAVAHELKKKILLVTVSEFRADKNAAEMMNFIFREARLNNNAIIFFDECESLFETREANPLVTSLLSDFEKYEGLVIMATNKAQNMDEAMNRRISLMIEFKLPGHEMRETIWRHHIPPRIKLHEDVRLNQLALNYELSGGLIRNAVLAGLQHAVAREKTETPTLNMKDLEEGAKQQLRGFFLASQLPCAASSKSYVTPKCVLSELVVKDTTRKQIETIAKLAKSRSTLFSQWGFSQDACENIGAVYLFSGPSGAGKSLAAEGIAFDCGATIRLCNLAELMLLQEINIHSVFEEARSLGAIVVFDQAQSLFNHSERSISISQMIQYYAMRYPRPVIVIATTRTSWDRDGGAMIGDSASWIDVQASRLVLNTHVVFHLPSRELRKELWSKAFPTKVPLAGDVDFDTLSNSMVSGKMIRTVAFNVCCQVALLPESKRKLDMKMIIDELEVAVLRERGHNSSSLMFA